MEGSLITLQDAANIVTLVAPGYFAIRTYEAIRSGQEGAIAREKEFSRILVESVTFSLPIVALLHWLWSIALHKEPISTNTPYAVALLFLSIFLGTVTALVRNQTPVKEVVDKIGIGLHGGDFIRSQFIKLKRNASVTITLKNGEIFSGTPSGGRVYAKDEPREYFFNNIAWYDKQAGVWVNRPGGIIINLEEVEYIETP